MAGGVVKEVSIQRLFSARGEMIKDKKLSLGCRDQVSVGQARCPFPGGRSEMQPGDGRDTEEEKNEVGVGGEVF